MLPLSQKRSSQCKEKTDPPLTPWKQEISFPCEKYKEDTFIRRDREFRRQGIQETCTNQPCYFLNLLPKPKFCLDLSLTKHLKLSFLVLLFLRDLLFLNWKITEAACFGHFLGCIFLRTQCAWINVYFSSPVNLSVDFIMIHLWELKRRFPPLWQLVSQPGDWPDCHPKTATAEKPWDT